MAQNQSPWDTSLLGTTSDRTAHEQEWKSAWMVPRQEKKNNPVWLAVPSATSTSPKHFRNNILKDCVSRKRGLQDYKIFCIFLAP